MPNVMVIGQTVANMAIFATFIIATIRQLGLIELKDFTSFFCKRVMSVTNIAAMCQTFAKYDDWVIVSIQELISC